MRFSAQSRQLPRSAGIQMSLTTHRFPSSLVNLMNSSEIRILECTQSSRASLKGSITRWANCDQTTTHLQPRDTGRFSCLASPLATSNIPSFLRRRAQETPRSPHRNGTVIGQKWLHRTQYYNHDPLNNVRTKENEQAPRHLT